MAIIKEIKSGNGPISFAEGEQVIHPEFGKGKIERITGSGENAKALVKFEIEGFKKLHLKYAKLTKIEKEKQKEEVEQEKEPQKKEETDE